MTRMTKLLFIAALTFTCASIAPSPAQAAAFQGYGQGYGQQTVNCSSNNGRKNYCGQFGNRDIRLSRQISGSPCVQGQTWGVDQGGLWTDRGCRADFLVGGGRPPGPPPSQTINCSSNDGRRNWCAIGSSRDVQLVRQISGSPCVRGNTWGIDNRGLWVDKGCRADFAIGGGGGGGGYRPPPQQMITCSSNDGKRNFCNTNGGRDVRLTRQISGSPCVQGQTWGYDNRSIWVDRGCRAEFSVR
jgi:hypothetical protein